MTVTEALRAAARHVEQHKAAPAWEGREVPSDGDAPHTGAKTPAFGRELDSLAAANETARV